MRALWGEGLRSLMVEGGSEVLGSFLVARLVDEVALFRAPILLGGPEEPPRVRRAWGRPPPRCAAAPGPSLPPFELWMPAAGLAGQAKSVVN